MCISESQQDFHNSFHPGATVSKFYVDTVVAESESQTALSEGLPNYLILSLEKDRLL